MKQIRLNKYTLKVENCGECPICDAPFWYCSLKADVREKNITAGTPPDCPLEVYEEEI